MIDHRLVKLGAKRSTPDERTLKIAKYLTVPQLPPAPPARTWSKAVAVPWGMLANDTLGDCTLAGICHFFMVEAANNGQQIQFDPNVVSKIYLSLTGGQDTGLELLDVLKYAMNTGIPDTTGVIHKIGAYAQVNTQDLKEVMAVINLFGGMYSGVALPLTAQNQTVWDVTDPSLTGNAAPDSWGSHCVPIPDYADFGDSCITWGELMTMTKAFFAAYFFEGWAVFTLDWIKNGVAPNGFDKDTLVADVQAVTGPPQQS